MRLHAALSDKSGTKKKTGASDVPVFVSVEIAFMFQPVLNQIEDIRQAIPSFGFPVLYGTDRDSEIVGKLFLRHSCRLPD